MCTTDFGRRGPALWETYNGGVAVPGEPRTRRSVNGDEPLAIRAEFVAVGGPEGESLAANQFVVIQEILLWLHRHTAPQVLGE
ncbi:hypothetical protein Airi01_088570 [Actinoallomurus iriomotensis]|uniref:Uncharacterized protein n=1 Tax=Actinoallomurus iriomotensis TaxID=478107 RepID=A0A9W6RVD1_9ACTN|nr:hypothetical protein Airi01_088570 [Actinoallomurus iriomotensis]